MSILTGKQVLKPYIKKTTGYIKSLLSSQHVEMKGGKTLQTAVDEINNNLISINSNLQTMLKCAVHSDTYTVGGKSIRKIDISSKIPRTVEYVAGWTAVRTDNPSLYTATLSTFGDITELIVTNSDTNNKDISLVVYVLYKDKL